MPAVTDVREGTYKNPENFSGIRPFSVAFHRHIDENDSVGRGLALTENNTEKVGEKNDGCQENHEESCFEVRCPGRSDRDQGNQSEEGSEDHDESPRPRQARLDDRQDDRPEDRRMLASGAGRQRAAGQWRGQHGRRCEWRRSNRGLPRTEARKAPDRCGTQGLDGGGIPRPGRQESPPDREQPTGIQQRRLACEEGGGRPPGLSSLRRRRYPPGDHSRQSWEEEGESRENRGGRSRRRGGSGPQEDEEGHQEDGPETSCEEGLIKGLHSLQPLQGGWGLSFRPVLNAVDGPCSPSTAWLRPTGPRPPVKRSAGLLGVPNPIGYRCITAQFLEMNLMADGQPARKTRDDRFRRQVLTKVDHFLSTMADVVQEYCEEHQVPLGTTSVSALLVMMRGGNRPRT